jgi:hypothetical protein
MSEVAAWYVAGAIVMWATGYAAGAIHASINRLMDASR